MKLLIFVLLISTSFSGITGEFAPRSQHHRDEQKFLDGIAAVINGIIRSIYGTLASLAESVGQWIQENAENIQNAVNQAIADYQKLLDEIRSQIDQLVDEVIRPCVEGLDERLEQNGNLTRENVEICREEGRVKLEIVREEIEVYVNSTRELVDGAREYVASCFNQANLGDAIKCGVDAARNVSATASLVRENNREIAKIIQTKVRDINRETRECVEDEISAGRERAKEILVEVGECIEEARKTTTTSSPPTESEIATTAGESE